MSFDPLVSAPDDPEMVQLRAAEPVARNPNGVWFLSRFDDVLAATKAIDTFNASFREPGVVVPDEEQFINEIPEPRHGQIRRIINGADRAPTSSVASSRSAPRSCHELLDDLLARRRHRRPRRPLRDADPHERDRHAARRAPGRLRQVGGVVRRGRAGHVPHEVPQRARRGPRRRAPRVHRLRRRPDRGRGARRAARRLHLAAARHRGRRPPPHRRRGPHPARVPASSPATRRRATSSAICCGRSRPTDGLMRAAARRSASSSNVAIEESLRLDPPIQFLMRNCIARDRACAAAQICPHDKVAFGIASANRDEGVFDDPDDVPSRSRRPERSSRVRRRPARVPRRGAGPARSAGRGQRVPRSRRARCARSTSTRYENVPVFWAHGPRELRVELDGT